MKINKIEKKSFISSGHVSLCRFGGINKLNKQKNNYKSNDIEPSYHQAPEKHGFYAFITHFVEPFLLGGVANGGKGRIKSFGKPNQCKNFDAVDGLIWTHIKPHKGYMIIEENGSWYKVNVKDLSSIIKKEFSRLSSSLRDDGVYFDYDQIVRNPFYYYSKDHMEVFICRDTIIS